VADGPPDVVYNWHSATPTRPGAPLARRLCPSPVVGRDPRRLRPRGLPRLPGLPREHEADDLGPCLASARGGLCRDRVASQQHVEARVGRPPGGRRPSGGPARMPELPQCHVALEVPPGTAAGGGRASSRRPAQPCHVRLASGRYPAAGLRREREAALPGLSLPVAHRRARVSVRPSTGEGPRADPAPSRDLWRSRRAVATLHSAGMARSRGRRTQSPPSLKSFARRGANCPSVGSAQQNQDSVSRGARAEEKGRATCVWALPAAARASDFTSARSAAGSSPREAPAATVAATLA